MSEDLLDELSRGLPHLKHRRPDPDMCRFMSGVRRCERHFRSFQRGRISMDECKVRCRRNYLATGAYMGPVGWADKP